MELQISLFSFLTNHFCCIKKVVKYLQIYRKSSIRCQPLMQVYPNKSPNIEAYAAPPCGKFLDFFSKVA